MRQRLRSYDHRTKYARMHDRGGMIADSYLGLRIPRELEERLRASAAARGIHVAQLVRKILWNVLDSAPTSGRLPH